MKIWKPHILAKSNILPIRYLSHITHDKEADGINQQEEVFVFKAKAKWGKCPCKLDGFPLGETFKEVDENKFEHIPFGKSVFPGQLSWWGINMHNIEETPEGIRFNTALEKAKKDTKSLFPPVPGYFDNPPQSRYGNKEFVIPFRNLMNSYKLSRTEGDVYLKLGGTLRYKKEVCYVVIVATKDDTDVIRLPSVHGRQPFIHNGCINEDGKLNEDETTPCFAIKHLFNDATWETLVFAFYFPDPHISQPKKPDTLQEIDHETKFCIYCPNGP